MKKLTALSLLFALSFGATVCATTSVTLNGVAYNMDTVTHYKAGPGAYYYFLRLRRASDNGNPQEVFIMKVDTKNPYISIESVMGKDLRVGLERPSSMAERKSTDTKIYFTGTNGDFYANSAPIGPTVCANEYVNTANEKNFQAAAVGEDNRGLLSFRAMFNSTLTIGDQSYTITRTNAGRDANELVFYNHYEGKTTGTNAYGLELLCRLPEGEAWHTSGVFHPIVVKKESRVGNMAIQDGHFVLSAHGQAETFLNAAQEGDTLQMNFSLDLFNTDNIQTVQGALVGCCSGADNYKMPVHDGNIETEPAFIWNENHPRTGFGYTQDNDTAIFCVWDGRNSKRSVGATTKMLGELMKYFGAWNALNLDGGGSSCLYIRNFGPVNNGSDGNERTVSNGLFAVANLPEVDNTYAELVPWTPTQKVAKYGVIVPECLGYNQYGLMLDDTVPDVEVVCDPSVGYLNDEHKVVALTSGEITVKKDNAVTKMFIEVADSPVALRLDTVLLGKGTAYNAEVQAIVDGKPMPAYAPAFNWAVEDETVASVDKGVITGLKSGMTHVSCGVGDFADTMVVVVEVPETPEVVMATTADTTVSFTSTRNATVTFLVNERLYGVPDSMRIVVCTDAPVSILDISAVMHNRTETVSHKRADAVPINEDYAYRIALADVFNVADQGIFPLTLQQLKFSFKDPKKNKDYRVQIKRIETVYGNYAPSALRTLRPNDAVRTDKMLRHGRMIIRKDNQLFDAQGKQIR